MRLPRRRFLQLAAGACALPAASRIASAQSYPTRPIRLVVPFPPGGAFDTIGRPWADRMKSLLGAVVIENIGGGGGSVGAAQENQIPMGGTGIVAELANLTMFLFSDVRLLDRADDRNRQRSAGYRPVKRGARFR